jgi:HSP20 family protein
MLKADPTQPRGAKDPSDMGDLFELFFGVPGRSNKPVGMQGDLSWRPATDVYETDDEFVVQIDLAGMRRSDIGVYVDDEFLIIRGVRSNIAPPGKKHFHKMEIMVGPFERHVRLPDNVDPSTARARYNAGFLLVRVTKGKGRLGERRTIQVEEHQ